jgi:hypothetical protein
MNFVRVAFFVITVSSIISFLFLASLPDGYYKGNALLYPPEDNLVSIIVWDKQPKCITSTDITETPTITTSGSPDELWNELKRYLPHSGEVVAQCSPTFCHCFRSLRYFTSLQVLTYQKGFVH